MKMLTTDRSGAGRLSVDEDFVKKNPEIMMALRKRVLKAPISDEAYRRQLNASLESDTYGRLSQIRAPTLIIAGKKDALTPPENGSILARGIPSARLIYFENSNHALLEDMDEVISSIIGFLV